MSVTENGDIAVDTFFGEGDAKLEQLIKVAFEAGYDGVFALELAARYSDPTEHITQAREWFGKWADKERLASVKAEERRGRFGGGPRCRLNLELIMQFDKNGDGELNDAERRVMFEAMRSRRGATPRTNR